MITMGVLVLIGLILVVMGLELRHRAGESALLREQVEQLRSDTRAYEATIEVREGKIEQLEGRLAGGMR